MKLSDPRAQVEVCVGCEHPIAKHFESVDGKVRCLVVEHGTSTRGVIGIPYTNDCDCVDFVSVRAAERRAPPMTWEQMIRDNEP